MVLCWYVRVTSVWNGTSVHAQFIIDCQLYFPTFEGGVYAGKSDPPSTDTINSHTHI